MQKLDAAIQTAVVRETPDLWVLPQEKGQTIAEAFGIVLRDVERRALENEILPQRYRRNWSALGLRAQLRLHTSTVALVGLGGLGGYVLELLARCGVGHVRGVDGDVFEPSNLNRQLLSEQATLGQPKVEAATRRVQAINPTIVFDPVQEMFGYTEFVQWIAQSDLVVDALGGTRIRLALHKAAAEQGVQVVSAAVAGATGIIATIAPGDEGLRALWQDERGAEEDMGCLAHGVAVLAGMQCAEVVNILSGKGPALQGCFGALDLNDFSWERFSL